MAQIPTLQQVGEFAKRNKYYIGGSVAGIALIVFLIHALKSASSKIISEAKKFVGIEEIGDNEGFSNKDFENKMKSVGWHSSLKWCNLFINMLVLSISKGKAHEFFYKHLSAATQTTWKNLQTSSEYHKVLSKPEKGCIVIYQSKTNSTKGHIELITKVHKDGSYDVISGNDTFPGTKNQGVAAKTRGKNGPSNLRILGYIKILKLK